MNCFSLLTSCLAGVEQRCGARRRVGLGPTAAPVLGAVLLLLVMGLGTTGSAVDLSSSSCPLSCGEAGEAWCQATFGAGGEVSLGLCGGDSSFQCVCNNVSTVNVTVDFESGTPTCSWNPAAFEELPGGGMCTPSTGLCPSSCDAVDNSSCYDEQQCAQDPVTGSIDFSCVTCAGREITIRGTNASCERRYSSNIFCDPQTTCAGHGCCSRPTLANYTSCTCYQDGTHGYWAQPQCTDCESGYDINRGCRQLISPPNFQIVLSSIATTWTMLCPNLAVPVLFVIFGIGRRVWDSDRSFGLTALRRAHLSPAQTARRNQQSLFHSKYVPRRPAKSRCFINEPPDGARAGLGARGPPAY